MITRAVPPYPKEEVAEQRGLPPYSPNEARFIIFRHSGEGLIGARATPDGGGYFRIILRLLWTQYSTNFVRAKTGEGWLPGGLIRSVMSTCGTVVHLILLLHICGAFVQDIRHGREPFSIGPGSLRVSDRSRFRNFKRDHKVRSKFFNRGEWMRLKIFKRDRS